MGKYTDNKSKVNKTSSSDTLVYTGRGLYFEPALNFPSPISNFIQNRQI